MNIENKQQSILIFRVGSILCCAPSLSVKSIITPPKFTKLPGSSKAHPGIFKHGSHIVKIIDLRQKFGVAEESGIGNLIIIVFKNKSFAFWVDQIIDILDFPSEGWSVLPAGIPKDVFTKTLILNKNIHLYTEFEKLITVGELTYFKNNTQQEKKSNDNDAEFKEGNKKTDIESSNEKTVKMVNQVKTHTPIKKTEQKIEIRPVITKRETPTTKVEKPIELNIKKQKPLKKNINTDKKGILIKVKPEKNIVHVVENTLLLKEESSSHSLFVFLTLFTFLSVATLYYLYPTDMVSSVKQENKMITLSIAEDNKIYDTPSDEPIKIIETLETLKTKTTSVIVESKPKIEKIITDIEKSDSHHAKIKKIENKVIIAVYMPKTVKNKLKPLIIHVVIKGDTLWDIAKKYINDPFRYLELVALNKIKNPHRIYPGDQVQIRFVQK